MKPLFEILQKVEESPPYLRALEEKAQEHRGVEFEYQEICKKLEPIFGKIVWSLIRERGNTNEVMKAALKAWERKRGGYLKWIIKELKAGRTP